MIRNILKIIAFILVISVISIDASANTPFKPSKSSKGLEYTAKVASVAGLYYISAYPKVLGGLELLSLTLGGYEDTSEALFIITAPILYNFIVADSDVGPEGRLEVFGTNIALMAVGHYTYKWFFKKESKPNTTTHSAITPLITPTYTGLAYTKVF